MKKEIKFRAWHKEKQMMFNLFAISSSGKILMTTQKRFHENKDYTNDNCILMQFTGLRDKNDVEIYEGDLVQSLPSGHEPRAIYKVEWCVDTVGFVFIELGKETDNKSDIDAGMIVIGNAYENPELLA